MSQFRFSAGHYIDAWGGNDSNPGTSPLAPRKTIANVTTLQLLGPGVYKTLNGSTARNLKGDGKVIIYGVTVGGVTFTADSIHFVNCNLNLPNCTFTDCVFENCVIGNRVSRSRCVFIGNTEITSHSIATTWNNNIIAQDPLSPLPTLSTTGQKSYNFIAKGARFRFSPTDLNLHIDNLCNGLLQLTTSPNTDWYEAKKLIDGSPRPDADPAIPDIIDVFPNFYTQGNFAGNAKMIDLVSRTVEPDSDLLKKQNANGFIGGARPAKFIRFDDADWTIQKIDINEINPNFLKVVDGEPFGIIRFTGRTSDTPISSQRLFFRSPVLFDADQPGGTEFNNNVPDSHTRSYGTDTKGFLPNRLTCWVRSSLQLNPDPDTDADWDNDSGTRGSIVGRYYLQEWGQRLAHHIIAGDVYGNSDANAINAATRIGFNNRSLDVIVILSQDRAL